jgi:hypothetical protein
MAAARLGDEGLAQIGETVVHLTVRRQRGENGGGGTAGAGADFQDAQGCARRVLA